MIRPSLLNNATTTSTRRRGSQDSTGSDASRAGSSGRSSYDAAAAAYTITEECERLFCGTLRATFLGEGRDALQDSLGMGAHFISGHDGGLGKIERVNGGGGGRDQVPIRHGLPTPPSSLPSVVSTDSGREPGHRQQHQQRELPNAGLVRDYVEIWTYVAGLRFRGFVAEQHGEAALFVFFDEDVVGKDLKKGLMAILELASDREFGCSRLVACLDRHAAEHNSDPDTDIDTGLDDLTRDLGWVGFEPTSLEPWAPGSVAITSPRWLLLCMEV